MAKRMALSLVLVGALGLASGNARADERPASVSLPTSTTRATPVGAEAFPVAGGTHAVALNFGLGSAVGAAGLTYALIYRAAEVEVGVGRGFTGWQTSGMLKLALFGTSTFRVGIGAGIAYTSAIPFTTRSIGALPSKSGNPVWLNVDAAALEYWVASHLMFTAALGITKGLGNGTYDVKVANGCGLDECDEDAATSWFPQARVGIGFWL